jgi:hypothetical protein
VAVLAAGSFASADPTSPVQARTGFDLVRVREGQFTIPLRYGHLIAQTDRVELDGRPLVRGVDYTIDLQTGAVMLAVPVKDGSMLRASYQYDSAAKQTGVSGVQATGGNGLTFKFNESTSGTIALGLVERAEDGTVLSSNVFGMQNAFSGGGFKLAGGIFLGQRTQSASTSLFGDSRGGNGGQEGQGIAIIQSLQSRFLGGTMTADFQDIGEKYAAVGQLNFAGDTNWLAKERGLKRVGFGVQGARMFGAPQSLGLKQVGDDQGAITWRSGDVKFAGLSLNWNQQKVDPGFTRFGDIREADRDQLAREKGLTRESLQVAGSGLKLDSDKVQGLDGNGVYRREGSLALGQTKFAFADQRVDQAFSRFGDLRLNGRDQLAREQGLSRQNFSFDQGSWLSLSSNVLKSDKDDFGATDLNFKRGAWNLSYTMRETGSQFDRMGSMTGQELSEHAAALERMIDPSIPFNGGDVGALINSAGISRSGMRLSFGGKASQWSLATETIDAPTGDVRNDQFAFSGGGTKFSFKRLDTSSTFSEFGRLLQSEQQRLGPSTGLQKTDLSFARDFGKGRSLELSRLTADDMSGSAGRTTFKYESAPLGINYVRRDATTVFNSAPTLSDPERDLLASLRGKGVTELNYHWSLSRRLNLQGQSYSLSDDVAGTTRLVQNQTAKWDLGKGLEFRSRFHVDSLGNDSTNLRDDNLASFGLVKDFGKLGKLGIQTENRRFDGEQDTTPDSQRTGLTYDLPVSKVFSLSTQFNQTRFSDGSDEATHAETLFAQISPRVGFSFTNSVLRQDLDTKPQTRRELGASVDFGKGIKLNYGQTRQVQDGTQGQLADQFSVTPGEVQGVQIDSAKYSHAGFDDQRDQYVGSFNFRNAKPLSWGGMKDVRFQYVSETVRDNFVWQREDRRLGFGANLAGISLDLGYRSQTVGDQYRAVDRTVKFVSDPSGKAPFRLSMLYGSRTLPNDTSVAVRDFSVCWNMGRGMQLEHSVVTNPLANGGPYLDTTPVDERRNQWSLKWTGDKSRKADLTWKEVLRDRQDDALYREASVNCTLFADNPSPLTFSYGLVQWDRNGSRQTSNRFALGFTQRPGPNQSLSFQLTNLNYGDTVANGMKPQNWGLRVDFFSRF